MRVLGEAATAMAEGLDRIRREAKIPEGFPDAVTDAAREAAARPLKCRNR